MTEFVKSALVLAEGLGVALVNVGRTCCLSSRRIIS